MAEGIMEKRSRHRWEYRTRRCVLLEQKRRTKKSDYVPQTSSYVWISFLITFNNETITETIDLNTFNYIRILDDETFVMSTPPTKEKEYNSLKKGEHFIFKVKKGEVMEWVHLLRASTDAYFIFDSNSSALPTTFPIEKYTFDSINSFAEWYSFNSFERYDKKALYRASKQCFMVIAFEMNLQDIEGDCSYFLGTSGPSPNLDPVENRLLGGCINHIFKRYVRRGQYRTITEILGREKSVSLLKNSDAKVLRVKSTFSGYMPFREPGSQKKRYVPNNEKNPGNVMNICPSLLKYFKDRRTPQKSTKYYINRSIRIKLV